MKKIDVLEAAAPSHSTSRLHYLIFQVPHPAHFSPSSCPFQSLILPIPVPQQFLKFSLIKFQMKREEKGYDPWGLTLFTKPGEKKRGTEKRDFPHFGETLEIFCTDIFNIVVEI